MKLPSKNQFRLSLKLVVLVITIAIVSLSGYAYVLRRKAIQNTQKGIFTYQPLPFTYYEPTMRGQDLFLHSIADTVDDVIDRAQSIVKVKVVEGSYYYGEATLSYCQVEKVYKGDEKLLGTTLHVYDLSQQMLFLDGCMPLEKDGQYLLFLQPAPKPTVKDTWMPVSTYYGVIRLQRDFALYLYEGEPPAATIPLDFDWTKYDHTFSSTTSKQDLETFQSTYQALQNQFSS